IPKDRLHAKLPDPLQGLLECVKAAEPLKLELAESNIGNIGGALDIIEPANRLIQHNGNGGYFRDTGVRVPIVGMAWLFKQLDAGGIEGRGKAAGVGLPYARLASIRIVARPAMACWIALTRLASASLPTLILKVRKPSLSRRSTSSSISFGVELLNGV